MWRAFPMPSADTVAQTPGGNFRPLSSFGQVWLAARAPGLERFSARIHEAVAPIVATATMAYKRVFFIPILIAYLYAKPSRARFHFGSQAPQPDRTGAH